MIATLSLALLLGGEPAMLPANERRVVYYARRKRRAGVVAPVTPPAPPPVAEPEQRRVRTIPIIEWDAFYRRVGL